MCFNIIFFFLYVEFVRSFHRHKEMDFFFVNFIVLLNNVNNQNTIAIVIIIEIIGTYCLQTFEIHDQNKPYTYFLTLRNIDSF